MLFEIGKVARVLHQGQREPVFGAAGSTALLLWVYYSAQILFFGAEFTQAYTKRYGSGIQPAEHAVKVTGEDRAQQGMVSDKRLAAKTAQAEGRAPARGAAPRRAGPRPGSRWRLRRFPATPRRGDARAATDRAAGASTRSPVQASWRAPWSAAWGRWRLAKDEKRPAKKHRRRQARRADAQHVEGRIGKLSRIQQYLENETVYQRIQQVEKKIRHARTAIRARGDRPAAAGSSAWATSWRNKTERFT